MSYFRPPGVFAPAPLVLALLGLLTALTALSGCDGEPPGDASAPVEAADGALPESTPPASESADSDAPESDSPESGLPESDPPDTGGDANGPGNDGPASQDGAASEGARLGFVGIERTFPDDAGTTVVHATVVGIGRHVTMARLLSLLAPATDACAPVPESVGPVTPLTSANFGETLVIDGPAGTWATLTRSADSELTEYRLPGGAPGALPPGATLGISGDPRERAMRVTLPDLPGPLSVTVSEQPDAPGGLALTWQPDPGAGAAAGRILIEASLAGEAWSCDFVDDGQARLDAGLAAGTDPGTDGSAGNDVLSTWRVTAAARLRRAIAPLDTAGGSAGGSGGGSAGGSGGDTLLIEHRRAGSIAP